MLTRPSRRRPLSGQKTLTILNLHISKIDTRNETGPTPSYGLGSIPNNSADVCGFLEPAESDHYWKIRLYGAFSIPHKTLDLRPTDQNCHHETGLHLEFVDWRSTQSNHEVHHRRILLKERPAACHLGQQKRGINDIMSDHPLSS